MEQELRHIKQRPIRAESASKAVNFFLSNGYSKIGEPVDCVFAGTALFRTLQTVEKFNAL